MIKDHITGKYPQIVLKCIPVQSKPYIRTPYQMIKNSSDQDNNEISQSMSIKAQQDQNVGQIQIQHYNQKHNHNPNHEQHCQKNNIQELDMLDKDNNSKQQCQKEWREIPPYLILMMAYLYFIQGVVLSIGATMPFLYPKLPSYSTLSLFALASLPWSLKFVTAPFAQKFNIISYGKRKTWIIFSQVCATCLLFVNSHFTEEQEQRIFALIMIAVNFFVTLQDISLDALAIKQLKSASLTGALVTVFQGFGIVFGGLLLLKLTSDEFAQTSLGRDSHLMDISMVLKVISAFILLPTLLIHFLFNETSLDMQLQVAQRSLWKVLCYYRIFWDVRSRHFRMAILFLFMNFGWNFFAAGYDYQLVKSGFSKDKLNSIANLITIPVAIIACPFSKIFPVLGILPSLMVISILFQVLLVLCTFLFPVNIYIVIGIYFSISLLTTGVFVVTLIMINSYPKSGVMGMFITMLGSAANLGTNLALHIKIIDMVSWKPATIFGLALQVFIIAALPWYYSWMMRGELGVNGQIIDNDGRSQFQIQRIQFDD